MYQKGQGARQGDENNVVLNVIIRLALQLESEVGAVRKTRAHIVVDFQHLRLAPVAVYPIRVVSQEVKAVLFRDERHVLVEHDGW